MKAVAHRLSKLKLTTFRVSYSPSYTNFVLNHIATNPSHPLYISQRRKQHEHKKEGLWWHATNGTDISKSGCVRTWARRRLRRAFVEELKLQGYDESGKLVDMSALQERWDVMNVLRLGRSVDLAGSLRMHGVGPLIPAKFDTIREEMRSIVAALVQSSVDTALGFAGEGERSAGLGQRVARTAPSSQSQRPQTKRPTAASSMSKKKLLITGESSRVKPRAPSQVAPRTAKTADGPKKTSAALPPRVKPRVVSRTTSARTRRPSLEVRDT